MKNFVSPPGTCTSRRPGLRGKHSFVDYLLMHNNVPLALVEAKDKNHPSARGMQQALRYADTLDVPFAYSSNGDAFLEHDRLAPRPNRARDTAQRISPSPAELWRATQRSNFSPAARNDSHPGLLLRRDGKSPRYYQEVAINRTVEAIASGQDRILLVMATGTGKTYTAFQIIWRLVESRQAKRILFLADRNILVDQTRTNDFKPLWRRDDQDQQAADRQSPTRSIWPCTRG